MTYAEWYSRYLRLYKQNISEKTRESYTRLHALAAPIIGNMELSTIMPDDIQAVLVAVETLAGSRQAQLAYSLLHAAFRRAVRSKRLQDNPVEAIDKPAHVTQEGRAIEGDDWQRLAAVISGDVAFALACFAGLRRGEVLGLRRGDIDLEAGLIRVERQRVRVGGQIVTAPPKSSAGVRVVPISPELLPIITRAVRFLLPAAYLVPISPETLGRRWSAAQKAAGITEPYRLHDLRHTYATRLMLEGINPRVLQYVIGHSDFGFTVSTYTHVGAAAAKTELSRVYNSLH